MNASGIGRDACAPCFAFLTYRLLFSERRYKVGGYRGRDSGAPMYPQKKRPPGTGGRFSEIQYR